MPAKFMSPSLGNTTPLESGRWEMSVSTRVIHSEDIYIGSKEQPQIKAAGAEPLIDVSSMDISFRYGINQRWSVTTTVPLIDSKANILMADGVRRSLNPGTKLGDIRVQANYWLKYPATNPNSNTLLSFGVKIPTGDDDLKGTFFTAAGEPIRRPLDISQQPGDGGWGFIIEGQWYRRFNKVTAYATGSYLFNPRNTNGVNPPQSNPPNLFSMSVPDQYSASVGISIPVWPTRGVSISIGGRVIGMPVSDVFGDSDGFRRPGRVSFVEPGLNWSFGSHNFSFSVPIAVHRKFSTSDLDKDRGVRTGGGLADYVIMASYSHQF